MPTKNQKGLIQILIPIILLAGIVATVWLVTRGPLKLFPKATVSKPIGPETSLTLIGPNDCAQGFLCALQAQKDPVPGQEFEIKLYVRSDIDEANLFQARMKFPKDLVEAISVKTDGSFVKNWVENFYDNDNNVGSISLVGGVPAPGYKTQLGKESSLMATIVFKAKVAGEGTVSFSDDSAIYRNGDNANILNTKRSLTLKIKGTQSPIPSPSPSPTPSPSPSPPVTSCTVSWTLSDEKPTAGTLIQVKVQGIKDKAEGEYPGGWQNVEMYLDGKTQDFGWGGISNPWPTFTYNKVPTGEPTTHTLQYRVDKGKRICSPDKTFKTQPLPPGQKGDGNKDGKINLIDMSVLLTWWNKGGKPEIDINNDGVINTFDFSLMRKLLLDLEVIKGGKG